MACSNCSCGKKDNQNKKSVEVNNAVADIETLNRLYLLGYLCNPLNRSNLSQEDEVLDKTLVEKFPTEVFINNYNLEIKNSSLKEFFKTNKENNFLAMASFLATTPIDGHKYFWKGYLDYCRVSPDLSRDVIEQPSRIDLAPSILFCFDNEHLLGSFLSFLDVSECDANISQNNGYVVVRLNHSQAFDLLYDFYKDESFLYRRSHWVKYILSTNAETENVNKSFKFMKTLPDAIAPFKARASDSGADLTIVKKVKQVGEVEFYDTGIILIPEYGYYFDVIPRSSISKSGYMLANSVGVIDQSYRGSVLVPLIKIDKNMPDLKLPMRIVQVIPRKIVHIDFQEVTNFEQTQRADGGFGSSNV